MLFGWVGGKSRLAKQIIGIFPSHKRYIEPFFGAGWIFFKKQPAEENIINDINGDLINLYIQVRDNEHDLVRLIVFTPKSEDQYYKFQELFENREMWNKQSPVRRAMMYYFLIKNSFNSNPLNGFGVNPGGNWYTDGLLETIFKMRQLLRNTSISNRDYKDILKLANDESLTYLDPPYMITTESDGKYYYENILTLDEHTVLRDNLINTKGRWVLSYDIHPNVDKLYRDIDGINIYKTSKIFQSSINKHSSYVNEDTYKTSHKQEYLITNFNIYTSSSLFQGD